MIPPINIRHDLGRLSAELGLLAREQTKAASRALNRTMTTVRAESARALRREYPGLLTRAIRRRMRIERATAAMLRAAVTFSGRRIGWFGNWTIATKRTRYGTGIRVPNRLPWRLETTAGVEVTRADLDRAFVARGGLWRRDGKAQYPIGFIVAPSLARTLVERAIDSRMTALARQRFAVVFAQEARFRLSQRGGVK